MEYSGGHSEGWGRPLPAPNNLEKPWNEPVHKGIDGSKL